MAWSFGDSFDLYAAPADMVNGYWDSGNSLANMQLLTGRFSGGRALSLQTATGAPSLTKSSGVNDAVHHLVVSFQQTQAISGSTLGAYFELFDAATAQCSVVFRSDGAILLTSGGPGGAVLATYTGAFTVASTWYAFEIEVVINNTTGSFAVRKNGNTVNDFSATALNTRPTSTNNYANKLQVGMNVTVNQQNFDDLFWQSGAATGTWLGDIRCYARMPASDQSVTWSRSGAGSIQQIPPGTFSATTAISNVVVRLTQLTVNLSGLITSLNVVTSSSASGNIKAAIWADNAGQPGAVLFSGASQAIVAAGNNVFIVSPAVSVVMGQKIWFGAISDTTAGNWATNTGGNVAYGGQAAGSFATFPQANPVATIPSVATNGAIIYSTSPGNWQMVQEAQEDGLTTYVYDSNPGDADFYGVGSIASTPAQVVATTVRGYMQKSDAGTRTAAVQLKSGATTVASPTLTLTTSGWQWAWRMDLTDPATGAAWTAAAVNNAQIGPAVVA